MFLNFGQFAPERRMVRKLRQRPLDPAHLETLRQLVDSRHRELPMGLLWKMLDLAEKALGELSDDDPRHALLTRIHSGALWEIQTRSRTLP